MIIQNMGYAPGLALGRCGVSSVSQWRLRDLLLHEDLLLIDVDKAQSSDRYDSVDWWRLDVHDLGFEPRLIWTPATVTPLLRWLSKHGHMYGGHVLIKS